eukprot:04290_5
MYCSTNESSWLEKYFATSPLSSLDITSPVSFKSFTFSSNLTDISSDFFFRSINTWYSPLTNLIGAPIPTSTFCFDSSANLV